MTRTFIAAIAIAVTLSGCNFNASLSNRLNVSRSSIVRDGDVKVVNESNPGQELDIKKFIRYGKYTVFEFTSDF